MPDCQILSRTGNYNNNNNIAEMAVFNVAGYLIEERRIWPVITASPQGQYSKKILNFESPHDYCILFNCSNSSNSLSMWTTDFRVGPLVVHTIRRLHRYRNRCQVTTCDCYFIIVVRQPSGYTVLAFHWQYNYVL